MSAEISIAWPPCPHCGAAYVPRRRGQVTCGAPPCRWRQDYVTKRADPARVAFDRARCRAYAAARGARPGSAWLVGAPPFAAWLPGGACVLRWWPRVPLDLARARHLHAALTRLHGAPHDPLVPAWALLPWQDGWAVCWADARGAALARTRHAVDLGPHRVALEVGPLVSLRAPTGVPRGRTRVRVDAVTPVVLRTMAGSVTRTAPEASHLRSTLAQTLARRLGVAGDDVRVELVERRTEPATTGDGRGHVGGDGRVRGWVGHVVLDVNAPARWLLEVAARGWGLGGRTAFGFGRVRVAEVDRG